MSDELRRRYNNARIAGGGRLDMGSWSKLVLRAAEFGNHEHALLRRDSAPAIPPSRRHEVCTPDAIPVRCQTILDVDATLAEMQLLLDEITETTKELMHEAIGQRLMRTLETARKTIADRLAKDARSHLKEVP